MPTSSTRLREQFARTMKKSAGRERKRQTRKGMKKKHHTRKKSRKHLRHKKTKKHRRHKNEAGRGWEEWNKLNDTYKTIHEQELQAQAEIDKANQIMRHPKVTMKQYNAAMKTRTKYENELRTIAAAARVAHKEKEQYEYDYLDSDLS